MATLTVWKFSTATGVVGASTRLQDLIRQGSLAIHDAATVAWEPTATKPRTSRLAGTAAPGALGDSFWSLLFGLIFLVPLLGAAMGSATGTVTGPLTDVGIDDTFLNRVRDQITPGTSALFVLAPDTVMDTVMDAVMDAVMDPVMEAVVDGLGAELAAHHTVEPIVTTLTAEQEKALRWVFTG